MVWFILMMLFVFVEANTVAVVSAWFVAGALAAMITGMLGGQLWLQVTVFFTVSAVLLLALRPLVRKHFTPKLVKTNVDAVIGVRGPVTERIDNLASCGQVKLGAMLWSAKSTSGQPIEAGTVIRVDRIEGVKVFVSPAEVNANL
jgi:membrane protein implicated in regulation of membrane protease activity